MAHCSIQLHSFNLNLSSQLQCTKKKVLAVFVCLCVCTIKIEKKIFGVYTTERIHSNVDICKSLNALNGLNSAKHEEKHETRTAGYQSRDKAAFNKNEMNRI